MRCLWLVVIACAACTRPAGSLDTAQSVELAPPPVPHCPRALPSSGLVVQEHWESDQVRCDVAEGNAVPFARVDVGATAGAPKNLGFYGVSGQGGARRLWFSVASPQGAPKTWVAFQLVGNKGPSVMVITFTARDRAEWRRKAELLAKLVPVPAP
jgi:hypothetical protein